MDRVMTGLLLVFAAAPLWGAEFTARVVDGLERPVPDALVEIYWLKDTKPGGVQKVVLASMRTDTNGMATGRYDESTVPAKKSISAEPSKAGYEGGSSGVESKELVLYRKFKSQDLDRIATVSESERAGELAEFLAGFPWKYDVESRAFKDDELFRPPLRQLHAERSGLRYVPEEGLERERAKWRYSGRNLTNVAVRVAKALDAGSWRGNSPPTFNSKRDKALVGFSFGDGRCIFGYTATFHQVDKDWVLRAVRFTFQALQRADVSGKTGKK